jgi:hypothetical protein
LIVLSPFRKGDAGGFDVRYVTTKNQIPLNRAHLSTDIQMGAQILAPPYLFLKGENTIIINKLCYNTLVSRCFVIPAKAGIQFIEVDRKNLWIPAFAGMTDFFAIKPKTYLPS